MELTTYFSSKVKITACAFQQPNTSGFICSFYSVPEQRGEKKKKSKVPYEAMSSF